MLVITLFKRKKVYASPVNGTFYGHYFTMSDMWLSF